ncbi:MAG: polysaccharide pyruvyl transferase family protein [Ignisphaera sp.]
MLKFFDHIYIVPTEVKDLKLVKPLTRRLNHNKCTLLDVSEMHPHAVKLIFQKIRLVVTSRSHAGILALASGTPTIMINRRSDLKFMDILGHYSLERYFVGIEDLTLRPTHFFTTIASMIKEIADSQSTIRKTIIGRNHLIRNLAELPGIYLKELLNN